MQSISIASSDEVNNPSWKYGFVDSLGLRKFLMNKLAFRPPSPAGYTFGRSDNSSSQFLFTPFVKGQPIDIHNPLIDTQTYLIKRKDGCCPVIFLKRLPGLVLGFPAASVESQGQARSQSCTEVFDKPIPEISGRSRNLFKTIIEESRPVHKQLVIYSHGNASDLGDVYFFGESLCVQYEVDFLAYDYTGYGLTKPQYVPSEQMTYKDLESVLAFAVCNLGYNLNQIILWGYSLGSGPTCEIASRFTTIAAVILQAPMASLYHWVDDHAPYQDGYANTKKIHSIRGRILIIHGVDDQVIPIRHSELLYQSYIRTNKNPYPEIVFVKIPDVGHHDMHDYVLDSMGEVGHQIYMLLKATEQNHHRIQSREDHEFEQHSTREQSFLHLLEEDNFHSLRSIKNSQYLMLHYNQIPDIQLRQKQSFIPQASKYFKDQILSPNTSALFQFCSCNGND